LKWKVNAKELKVKERERERGRRVIIRKEKLQGNKIKREKYKNKLTYEEASTPNCNCLFFFFFHNADGKGN